jgi:hypothetical protein
MQPVKEKPRRETNMRDDEADEDVYESGYNELLFFDFECIQENGTHEPNLCVIQNEAGHEWMFQGDNTRNEFCEWLFTKEHEGCIVVAHNFQGYDGYFIQQYLHENVLFLKSLCVVPRSLRCMYLCSRLNSSIL